MQTKSDQHLNSKLWELSIEMAATRSGFGDGLLQAGEKNEKVVALTCDLKESTKLVKFAEKYPARFFDLGVAEQNLAGTASGLAAMGKIPFMTSYAVFSPGRNWEHIRTTICYNNRNVKIVGSHAGLSVGPDGGSHQALEDIALTRVLPNMTVIAPCDALEAMKATIAAADHDGPVYLRLTREKTPVMTTDDSPFEIGKANLLIDAEKPQVGIVACGPILYEVLRAAKKLNDEHISVSVLNMHTIKPLDGKALLELARKTGAIVTVEEHQQAGGLGSAVAEYLAQDHPVPIEFVGVNDRFGQSGEAAELIEHYGLSAHSIMAKVKLALARKVKALHNSKAHTFAH
jgi:transketolase